MFHLNAHHERCRSVFSPYLLLHHARMDGEGVERHWAMLNGYAPATREMGPGSRRDILDDIFADQNWAKVTKLGTPYCNLRNSCFLIVCSGHTAQKNQTRGGRAQQPCHRTRRFHEVPTSGICQELVGHGCGLGSVPNHRP